jgi:hypothetical protein
LHFYRIKQTFFTLGNVLAIVSGVVTLVALATSSAYAAAPLGKSLVDLESHIKWTAVEDDWKGMRTGWIGQTTACSEPECVAKQMEALEEHLKWEAVDPAWKTRRDNWVSECNGAKTNAEVRKLLLDLEQNVGWKAVDDNWKGHRDAWMEVVKKD